MTRTMRVLAWGTVIVPLMCVGVADVAGAPKKEAAAKKKDAKEGDAKKKDVKESAEAKKLAEEAAQAARKEREQRVPEVVKEAARVKEDAAKAGPRLSAEEFRRTTEFKVQGMRDEQIATLDQIIKLGPPAEELPDLLFQKAELYFETSQFHFFQANAKDDEIFAAREAEDKAKEEQLQKEKAVHQDKSQKWARDSEKVYAEIVQKHRKFSRMDQVLFALGATLMNAGKQQEALDVYRKVIKEYPKSPYVADAYLALGEYSFSIKKIDSALGAYEKAATFEDSPVYGYAVYKQGWCHYNQTDWAKAAEKFKEVILYSQLNDKVLGDKKVILSKEARKDYVTVFSHFGKPEVALTDFKDLADTPEEYRAMVERLANLYYSSGQDREAAVVYVLLINHDKEHTRNPFYQARIVSCATRQGNKRIVVKHARKLVEEFQRVREIQGKLEEKDPLRIRIEQDTRDAEEIADNSLRSLSTSWHNEARKTRDEETYEMAYELYGDYLDLFPDKKPAYDMRFFYAELNYKLERFEKAAEEYTKVLLQRPDGRWAEPAAEEAVRAYDELVSEFDKKNKRDAQTTDFDPTKPLPIPDTKKKYLSVCLNYLKYFPEGRINTEVNYKVARVMYDHNIWDKSLELFTKLIRANPEHPRSEQAASLVLDVHNLREDWESLYNAAREYQASNVLMSKPEFAKGVLEVLESSSFKVIAKMQRVGKYEEAAKRYLSFVDEFPKSQLADKALANAAANYLLAGMTEHAVKTRERLIKTFPDSPLVPDSLYAVAESYEAVAELDKAADALEHFTKKYPNDPRTKDALFNAGIYREGYGGTKNLEKAIADREAYLKAYGKSKDAAAVSYSIARLYEQSKQYKKAQEAYEAYAKKHEKDDPQKAWESRFKAMDLTKQVAGQKAWEEAQKRLYAEYKKKHKRLPEGRPEAARIAFADAEVAFDEFKKLKIENPDLKNMKKFQKSLADKAKGRDVIRGVYTGVVKLKDPEWAIAALYRIGDLNSHYMNSILAVPAPPDLKGEQKEIFKEKLAERAAPIDEEAVGAFKFCIQKSQELHVFNQWTAKCLDVLEEKRPDEFPKVTGERKPTPPVVPPPMPRFLVVDLPKEDGDYVALPAPPRPPPEEAAPPEGTGAPAPAESPAGGAS